MLKINNFKIFGLPALLLLSILFNQGCNDNGVRYDAAGTFEAREVLISAEANGVIREFDIEEGREVREGDILGFIDSTDLYLAKMQLIAKRDAVESQKPDIAIQLGSLREQLNSAQRERERVIKLYNSDAATRKQIDDINSQIEIIGRQIDAVESTLSVKNRSIGKELMPLSIQIRELDVKLRRCKIVTPMTGVVLDKYAERYEMTSVGKVLFKVADLSEMRLRAYISGCQLLKFKLGEKIRVMISAGDRGFLRYDGVVEWISDRAEFTPKTIQSKDERDNLVYALKIRVKNDGNIKIGMYGEVFLDEND